MSAIRNLILDMGNVLLTYEPEYYVRTLCRETSRQTILNELFLGPDWPLQDLGYIGQDALYHRVMPRVPEAFHEDLRKAVYGWSSLMRPLPGAHAFLDEMKKDGYRLFVLSNAGKDFHIYFPKHYDTTLFDGIVVSADLHITKPDPGIYRHLLDTFDLDPSECLFSDDMQRNVDGALACGIHGFVFTGDFRLLADTLRRRAL